MHTDDIAERMDTQITVKITIFSRFCLLFLLRNYFPPEYTLVEVEIANFAIDAMMHSPPHMPQHMQYNTRRF